MHLKPIKQLLKHFLYPNPGVGKLRPAGRTQNFVLICLIF